MTAPQPLFNRVTVARVDSDDGTHSVHYFGRSTVLEVLVHDPDPHTQYVCGILSLTHPLSSVAIRETNDYRVMVVGHECVWLTHEVFQRIHKRAAQRRAIVGHD